MPKGSPACPGCLSSELSVQLLNGQPDRARRTIADVPRHLRRRPLLHRGAGPRPRRPAQDPAPAVRARPRARHPGRGHERPALHAEGRRQAARRAALHPAAEAADRPEAAPVRRRRVLPEERRGDAARVRRSFPTPATTPSRSPSSVELDLVYGDRAPADQRYHLPRFETPGGIDRDTYLRQLVDDGAAGRYGEITPEIRERIDHELGVITSMGFGGYFLIVWDLIRHAREQGIRVGPGRGSAAGLGRELRACASPTSIRCATGCCSSGS